MFKMRTTKPKNNKYYMRKASGGYSDAVLGKPTDPTADVLSNCVGYANGRFAEIIGKDKIEYQLVCNAENFIERAEKYGLKISSVPTLGGIMVWQKGATLKGDDGAGHVAIVERIDSKNKIYTSESAYGSTAFFNATRTNDNGRWGMSSKYKFRGCIINPAVGDVHYVEPPKPKKLEIQYQVYDNKKKKWLGVITNYNNINSNGYAGITGNPIGGIRAKASDGSVVTIKSHIRGGKWLSEVKSWNDTPNGYSGIKGRSIDMFMVKCEGHTVHYRAHIKGGSWLSWITMYNQNNPKGYAGMMGREIDKIQMYID